MAAGAGDVTFRPGAAPVWRTRSVAGRRIALVLKRRFTRHGDGGGGGVTGPVEAGEGRCWLQMEADGIP